MATASVASCEAGNNTQHLRTLQQGDQLNQAQTQDSFPPSTTQWGTSSGMNINYAGEDSSLSTSNYYTHPQTQGQNAHISSTMDSCLTASSTASITSGNNYTDYSAYNTYYNNYPYGSTSYTGYNYGYPEQGNHSYSQHGAAYQNSGAAYPSVNSFQNASSHTESTHYGTSTTYYNPGVYQTMESYRSIGYNGQTAYPGYPGYAQSDGTNQTYGAYSAYPAYTQSDAATNQAQSHNYQTWNDYYKQTEPDAICPPGTEPTVPSTSGSTSLVPSMNVEVAQPPPPGTQPSSQTTKHTYYDTSLHQGQYGSGPYFQQPSFIQSYQVPQSQVQEQKQMPPPQGQLGEMTTLPSPSQNVTPSGPTVLNNDPSQRSAKLQIPTNPRIASTLGFNVSDASKRKTGVQSQKPSYTKVNAKVVNSKPSVGDSRDAAIKQETFPPSLCHYVERALERCKDEAQTAACQEIMKEIITKASDDGSLFTRDWDTEPLFPLPTGNAGSNIGNSQNVLGADSIVNSDRSQSKRYKSRWEPLVDEKQDKQHRVVRGFVEEGAWDSLKEDQNKASKSNGTWNSSEEILNQEQTRLSKRARTDFGLSKVNELADQVGNTVILGAAALNETLEEKKRRESRNRRFSNAVLPKHKDGGTIINKSTNPVRAPGSVPLAKSDVDGNGFAVEDLDWDSMTVKGTCQDIEKSYLRLTSAPDSNTVRPEEVLHQALAMVENSSKNYLYKCDQLKSIRQDLTVQRIRNEFTVKVYETHARLAIDARDIPEYNQCQSQLKGLYAEGIKGCEYEFLGYNLLYHCLNSGNTRDLLASMARLSKEAREHNIVKHALAVRAAVSSSNYKVFFHLHRSASSLSACLMDGYTEKMRFEAIRCISRAYRPSVPVSFIAETLGFTNSGGLDECEEWLRAHGAVLAVDKGTGELVLNPKDSAFSLFMPDPEDAVCHGGASLAVNDFLARG